MSSKDEKKSSKKKHDSGKRAKKTSYELLEPIYVMEVNSLGQKFDNQHHIYEKPSASLGGQNLVQRISPDPNITFCPSNENPHNSLAGSPNISYISQCSGQSATLPQAYLNSLNSQTAKPVTNCNYQTAQNTMYPPTQPVAYLSAPPIWPFYPGGHNVISVSPALTTDEDKSTNKKKKKHKSHKLDESKSSSSDVDNDRKREKHSRHRRHAHRERETSPRPSNDQKNVNNEPVYYQAFPVSDFSRYDRGSVDSRRYSTLGGRRMSLREVEAHRRKRREEMEPKYRGGRDYDEETYTRSVRAGRRPSRYREPDRARSERRRRSTYRGRSSQRHGSSQRHSSSDEEPYTGTYARSLSITKSRGGSYEKTTNDVLFDLCRKVEDLKERLNSKENDKKCRCQEQKQQEEVCCCEEQPSCACCCEDSPPAACCCEESESEEEEYCACKNDVRSAYPSRGCMCGPQSFMYSPQPSDQTDLFYAQTYNNMNPILYYPTYANLMSPMPQPTFERPYMPLENGMISRVPTSQMMPMAQSHPYQQEPMQAYSDTTQAAVIKSSSVDSSGDKTKYEQNKPSVKAKSVNTLLSISERAASEENMLSLSKKAFSAYEEATKNDKTSSEGPEIIVWPEGRTSTKSNLERSRRNKQSEPSSDKNIDEAMNKKKLSRHVEWNTANHKKSSLMERRNKTLQPNTLNLEKRTTEQRNSKRKSKLPASVPDSSGEDLSKSKNKNGTIQERRNASDTRRSDARKSEKVAIERRTNGPILKPSSKKVPSSDEELYKPSYKKSSAKNKSKESPKSEKIVVRRKTNIQKPSLKSVTSSDEELYKSSYKKVTSAKKGSTGMPETRRSEKIVFVKKTSPSTPKPSSKIVTSSVEELYGSAGKKSTSADKKSTDMRPKSHKYVKSVIGGRTSASIPVPPSEIATSSVDELYRSGDKKSTSVDKKNMRPNLHKSVKSVFGRRTSASIRKPSSDILTSSVEELYGSADRKSAPADKKIIDMRPEQKSFVGRRTHPSISKPSSEVVTSSVEELYGSADRKSATADEKIIDTRPDQHKPVKSFVGRRTHPSIPKPTSEVVTSSVEQLYLSADRKSAPVDKRSTGMRPESHKPVKSFVGRRTHPSIPKPTSEVVTSSVEELYGSNDRKSAPVDKRSTGMRPESHKSIKRVVGRRTCPSIVKPSSGVVTSSVEELYGSADKKSTSADKEDTGMRSEQDKSVKSVDGRRTSPSFPKRLSKGIASSVGELFKPSGKKSTSTDNSKETRPKSRKSLKRIFRRRTSPSITKPSTVTTSDEELCDEDYKKSTASPDVKSSVSRPESYNSEKSVGRRTSPRLAKSSTVTTSGEELCDEDYKKSDASPEKINSLSRPESCNSESNDGRRTSPSISSKPSSIIFSSSNEKLRGSRYRKTTIIRRGVTRKSERSDCGQESGPSTPRIVSSSNEDLYKKPYRKTISSETRTTRLWPETNKSETSVITRTKTVTELPPSAANNVGEVRNTTFKSGKSDKDSTGDVNSSNESLSKEGSRKSPISQEHRKRSESEEGIFGEKEIESQQSEKNKNGIFEQRQSSNKKSEPSPDKEKPSDNQHENSSLGEETYIWANVSGYENTHFGRKQKYIMTDTTLNTTNISVKNEDKTNEDRGWILEDERKASLRPDIYEPFKYIVEGDKFRRKPVTKKKRESSLLRLKRILNDETAKPGKNRSRSSSFIMERKRSGDKEKFKSRTNEGYGSGSCSMSSLRSYSAQTDSIEGIGSQSDDINERNYSQTDETSFPRIRDYTNIFPCEYCPCNNETSKMKNGKDNKRTTQNENDCSCPSLKLCDLQKILNSSQQRNQQSTYNMDPQVSSFDSFQDQQSIQNMASQVPAYNAYQGHHRNALNMPPQVPSYDNQPIPVGYEETHPFQGVPPMPEVPPNFAVAAPNLYMSSPVWPTVLNGQPLVNTNTNTPNTTADNVSPTNSMNDGSSSAILLEKRDGKIVKQWECRPISMNKEDSSSRTQKKSMKRKVNADNVLKQNVNKPKQIVDSQTKQKLKTKKVEYGSKIAKYKEPSKVSLDRLKTCEDCFELLQYIQEQLWKPTDLEFFERHGKRSDHEKGKNRELAYEEKVWPYELSLGDYSEPWDDYDAFAHDGYSQLPWTNYETLTPETYTPPPASSRRMIQWGPYLGEQALRGSDSSYDQNSPDNRKKRGKSRNIRSYRRTSYGQRKSNNWRNANSKESASSLKNISEEGKELECKCSNPSCSGYRRRKESGICRCKKSPEREENSVDIDRMRRQMSDRDEPTKPPFVPLDKQIGSGSMSHKRSSYKQWSRTVVHDPIKNSAFLPKEELLAIEDIPDNHPSTLRSDRPTLRSDRPRGSSRRTGKFSSISRLPKKDNQSQTTYNEQRTVKTAETSVADDYLLSALIDKQTSTHFEGTNICESAETTRSIPLNDENNTTQIEIDEEQNIHPNRRKFSDTCFIEEVKKIEEKTSFCFLSPRCPNTGGRRPYIECIGEDDSGYLLYSDESVNIAHTVFRRKKNGKKRGFPVFIRKPRKKKKEKKEPDNGNLDLEDNGPTVFRAILSQPKFLQRIHSEDTMDSDDTILVTCNDLSNSSNKIISDSNQELPSVLFDRNVKNKRYTFRKKYIKKPFPHISIRKAVKNKYNFIKSSLSFKSKLDCRTITKKNILTKLINNEKSRDIIPNLTEEQLQNYIKSNMADNSKGLAIIPIQPSKFIIDINSNKYANTFNISTKSDEDTWAKIDADTNTSTKSNIDTITKIDADTNTSTKSNVDTISKIDADTNTSTKNNVDTITKIDADTNTSTKSIVDTISKIDADTNTNTKNIFDTITNIDADTNTSTKSDLTKIDADTSTKNDAEINTSFKNDADTNTIPTYITCPRCNSYSISDTNIKFYENRISDMNFKCGRGLKFETKQQNSIEEERDKIYIHHMKSYQKTIRRTHQPFEFCQRGNRVRTIAINPRVLIIRKYPSNYKKTNEIQLKESKHRIRRNITMATLSRFQMESDEIILRCAQDRKCAKSTVQYSDSLEFQLDKKKKGRNLESIKENESNDSQPSEDD